MTIEMENFLYELNKYAGQVHTLKDAYEALSPDEQEKAASLAPSNYPMPFEQYKAIFEWLEQMQTELGITDGQ
ncbi:hypothetical protein [Lentibacillus sp. CBA3610]|uniref:hypothetical protein n=1 Tax=Lentibacillus sp. CBA3610 TaxID=2518176 RepID=UPI0015952579|nr:hypothetical protein [Lentibacillus sp. CBA3610]QKY68897.1 hypothetical protein Len3610_04015 [Lentibacillus sp. CBA3610]